MASGDLRLLERVLARLGDAVIDPAIWPELMSEICQATGATSGILLQTDVRLASLSARLTEVATLSTSVGRIVLTGATSTLSAIARPAVALDRRGKILDINTQAAMLFDDDLHVVGHRLIFSDAKAQSDLDDFIDHMQSTEDTSPLRTPAILARRKQAPSVLGKILPVPAAARNPFFGARAILLFSVLAPRPAPEPSTLMQAFGLSEAEARVAAHIASGSSPEEIAEHLNVSIHTVRTQLKSIFAKAKIGRQSELVALLSTLA